MQKISVTPPQYIDFGRQMSTMAVQKQTVDRGAGQNGTFRVAARRVVNVVAPCRAELIDALEVADRDEECVAPSALIALIRPRFAEGAHPAEVAGSIADEYLVSARLYATLLRLVESFAPLPVVHIEPADARLDDVDDDKPETGWNGDGFQEFLARASHDLLSFEEEQALGRAISEGRVAQRLLRERRDLPADDIRAFQRIIQTGRRAQDELARRNMRLVMHVAFRLQGRCTPSLGVEDLVDEGYFGLATAIDKWDHTRGLKFSTYAMWWIRQTMERAIANQSSAIRIPVHMQETIRRAWRAEQELRAHGVAASDAAVAEKLGMTVQQVVDLRSYQHRLLSLDAPGRGDVAALILRLPDPRAESEQDALFREVEDDELLALMLADLSERQQQVISRRFGLDDGQRRTLEKVGEEFGVTRERIRQIEDKVIKRLRRRMSMGAFGPDLQEEILRRFGDEEEVEE